MTCMRSLLFFFFPRSIPRQVVSLLCITSLFVRLCLSPPPDSDWSVTHDNVRKLISLSASQRKQENKSALAFGVWLCKKLTYLVQRRSMAVVRRMVYAGWEDAERIWRENLFGCLLWRWRWFVVLFRMSSERLILRLGLHRSLKATRRRFQVRHERQACCKTGKRKRSSFFITKIARCSCFSIHTVTTLWFSVVNEWRC